MTTARAISEIQAMIEALGFERLAQVIVHSSRNMGKAITIEGTNGSLLLACAYMPAKKKRVAKKSSAKKLTRGTRVTHKGRAEK